MARTLAQKLKSGLLHPLICLPLVLLLLLAAALYWYPPLWQASYTPKSDAPFFQQAAAGVDINHASLEELTVLPGIGPKKARAIVEYREENGLFTGPGDLLLVNGIGPATLEELEDRVVFLPR